MKKSLLLLLCCVGLSIGDLAAQQVIEATPATFNEAIKSLRKATHRQKSDVEVRLHGGTYHFTEPLVIDESLGGKNGYKVRFVAAEGETPVISGGVAVKGWEQVHGNLYKAPFKSDRKQRTLIVGGKRARMAGMNAPVKSLGSYGEIEVTGNEPWAFGAGKTVKGLRFEQSAEVLPYRNPMCRR